MKKNLNKLIAQVELGVGKSQKPSFKITSENVNLYTNKILVDAN